MRKTKQNSVSINKMSESLENKFPLWKHVTRKTFPVKVKIQNNGFWASMQMHLLNLASKTIFPVRIKLELNFWSAMWSLGTLLGQKMRMFLILESQTIVFCQNKELWSAMWLLEPC